VQRIEPWLREIVVVCTKPARERGEGGDCRKTTRMLEKFSGKDPIEAARKVVAAIRARDWPTLENLLAHNREAAGTVDPWREAEPQSEILDDPQIQTLPSFIARYPGKTLVRFPLEASFDGQKLEVIVDRLENAFFAIDFWGFGWP
jgi:hypothetical protein